MNWTDLIWFILAQSTDSFSDAEITSLIGEMGNWKNTSLERSELITKPSTFI